MRVYFVLFSATFLLRFLMLRIFLHGFDALWDDKLTAVHTGRFIEAMWEAELAALFICDDNLILQSMVASAVLGMRTSVAHSY